MCTCRYCLCFFNMVVILNTCMLGVIVCTYLFFGNMPPSFTMAMGFWLLLYTNYFGIYVTLLSEATFYRNQDIWWINKLTQWGIVGCAICFALGAILFLIPLSAEAMMSFSKFYYKVYGDIPPFLDNFQSKVKCCGIYNYTDYGRHDYTNYGYGSEGFYVHRQANPNDDFWHQLITDFSLNRTVARKTTGLDVPQSCCQTSKALSEDPKHKDCGKKVEYTGSNKGDLYIKQEESAREKVNNPQLGCFEKYSKIWETGYQFSLTYLLGVIQFVSLFQCALFLVLLWFHKLALKTIRQLNYWLPTLVELHESVEFARAHAGLEAEADEAHERDEHVIKAKARPSDFRAIEKKKSQNLQSRRSKLPMTEERFSV